MFAVKNSPPPLGPLARAVHDVLERHTAFPWPVLKSQCRRRGIDPRTLTPITLGAVIEDLAFAIARFNTIPAGMAARRELVELQRVDLDLDEVG